LDLVIRMMTIRFILKTCCVIILPINVII
jgi:hypothetical protein